MIKTLNKRSAISLEIVLVLVFFALLNSESFAQEAVDKAPADVVEIETEIGMDQLKRSEVVNKPGIKPRAVYNNVKGEKKNSDVSATAESPREMSAPSVIASSEEARQSKAEITSSQKSLLAMTDSTLSEPAPIKKVENTLTDVQVVEISDSLRKLIEENEGLKKELDQLDQQLKAVRGQQKLESNRINEIVMERNALKKQNENIIALGAKSDQNLTQLQAQLAEKENEYNLQIVRLQTELAQALRANPVPPQAEQLSSAANPVIASSSPSSGGAKQSKPGNSNRSIAVDVAFAPAGVSEEVKKQGEKVLMALDSVNREKAKLTRDEAKLHYNMGNTYFNEGDYPRAAAEYSRAVELAPEDANAHYNFAFVSGDFLNDPVTALKHYKMYLFLNPGAEDGHMVRQKMIEAEISVKADVRFRSKINREVQQKKNEFNDSTQF